MDKPRERCETKLSRYRLTDARLLAAHNQIRMMLRHDRRAAPSRYGVFSAVRESSMGEPNTAFTAPSRPAR